MGRRSPGDGSITYIKAKKLFMGRITLGYDETGKQDRKTLYDKTKTGLIEKMQEYRRTSYGLKNSAVTFGDWFYRWLYGVKKKDLKPKSFQRYESFHRNYLVNSPFNDVKLTDITFYDIKTWYSDLEDNGTSLDTIKYMNSRIFSVFELAIEENIILSNPVKKIKLRKLNEAGKEEIIKAWTAAEQVIFKTHITSSNDEFRYLFMFALGSGFRLGECLALTWDDLDLTNRTVKVNKSLSRVKQDDGSYKDEIVSPKTLTSHRINTLPKGLVNYLKDIPRDPETDLVFYNPKTKSYVFNKSPNRHLQAWCEELEITRITFHNLRATYATRLFESGVALKVVQKLLGHKNIETTERIYVQVMPDIKEDAVEKLDGFF